jgi:hypothetical protein
MSRGRNPGKAIGCAAAHAERFGLVRFYEQGPGCIADFSIISPPILRECRIKRMRHIRCTAQWLERDAMDEIASLKMYPSSPQISRELWIVSPSYYIRFFRVLDNGLAELDPDGRPIPLNSPAPKPTPCGPVPAPVRYFRRRRGEPLPAPGTGDTRESGGTKPPLDKSPSESEPPGSTSP